jgi:hypothetical protein
MAVDNITVSLRVWHRTGAQVPKAEFIGKLSFKDADFVKKNKKDNSTVKLLSLVADDFSEAEEQSEAFAEAIKNHMLQAAEWLATQSPEVFAALRANGYITDICVTAWIDSDQMDLDFPPEFLRECGLHGLAISIITND